MMFHCANQSHQRNQEQEDAHSDDHTHHPETGDQSKADTPSSNPNEQQTDELWRDGSGSIIQGQQCQVFTWFIRWQENRRISRVLVPEPATYTKFKLHIKSCHVCNF